MPHDTTDHGVAAGSSPSATTPWWLRSLRKATPCASSSVNRVTSRYATHAASLSKYAGFSKAMVSSWLTTKRSPTRARKSSSTSWLTWQGRYTTSTTRSGAEMNGLTPMNSTSGNSARARTTYGGIVGGTNTTRRLTSLRRASARIDCNTMCWVPIW